MHRWLECLASSSHDVVTGNTIVALAQLLVPTSTAPLVAMAWLRLGASDRVWEYLATLRPESFGGGTHFDSFMSQLVAVPALRGPGTVQQAARFLRQRIPQPTFPVRYVALVRTMVDEMIRHDVRLFFLLDSPRSELTGCTIDSIIEWIIAQTSDALSRIHLLCRSFFCTRITTDRKKIAAALADALTEQAWLLCSKGPSQTALYFLDLAHQAHLPTHPSQKELKEEYTSMRRVLEHRLELQKLLFWKGPREPPMLAYLSSQGWTMDQVAALLRRRSSPAASGLQLPGRIVGFSRNKWGKPDLKLWLAPSDDEGKITSSDLATLFAVGAADEKDGSLFLSLDPLPTAYGNHISPAKHHHFQYVHCPDAIRGTGVLADELFCDYWCLKQWTVNLAVSPDPPFAFGPSSPVSLLAEPLRSILMDLHKTRRAAAAEHKKGEEILHRFWIEPQGEVKWTYRSNESCYEYLLSEPQMVVRAHAMVRMPDGTLKDSTEADPWHAAFASALTKHYHLLEAFAPEFGRLKEYVKGRVMVSILRQHTKAENLGSLAETYAEIANHAPPRDLNPCRVVPSVYNADIEFGEDHYSIESCYGGVSLDPVSCPVVAWETCIPTVPYFWWRLVGDLLNKTPAPPPVASPAATTRTCVTPLPSLPPLAPAGSGSGGSGPPPPPPPEDVTPRGVWEWTK